MHPHPPCSTAVRLRSDSGDITSIKLIHMKYEGKHPPFGAHGEKTMLRDDGSLSYSSG